MLHRLQALTGPCTASVLLRPCCLQVVEAAATTTGGLLLTEGSKEKPTIGKVVAVGPGRAEEEGKEAVKPKVEVGATVLYQKYAGTEVRLLYCMCIACQPAAWFSASSAHAGPGWTQCMCCQGTGRSTEHCTTTACSHPRSSGAAACCSLRARTTSSTLWFATWTSWRRLHEGGAYELRRRHWADTVRGALATSDQPARSIQTSALQLSAPGPCGWLSSTLLHSDAPSRSFRLPHTLPSPFPPPSAPPPAYFPQLSPAPSFIRSAAAGHSQRVRQSAPLHSLLTITLQNQ